MKISVVGSGYVGLVTGGCLAEIGHEVVCTDSDLGKIEILESGMLPIYEPGLEDVIARNRAEKRLSFEREPAKAVAEADVIFICVGTPPLPNGDADLSAIDSVARLVGTCAHGSKLVIEKSTVPAQTGQQLMRAAQRLRPQWHRKVSRRLESRILARRNGGLRLLAPGSHRSRRRRRTDRKTDA